MCERVKLTPLTPEEQAFAEENYSIMELCMRLQGIDDDLYGAAATGYLMAVKKWFARPDLQKWSFQTIVKQTVRSYVGAERKKLERCIKTVSLDDVIPGTDDMTYGETVTVENLRYLTEERKREVGEKVSTKITYDAEIPVTTRRSAKASLELLELKAFLESNHYVMCFEFDDAKEAGRKRDTFYAWKKNHKRTDFKVCKVNNMIYVEKLDAEPKKGEK